MKIIIDLDDTLTIADSSLPYNEVLPNSEVVKTLRTYKDKGFEIVVSPVRFLNLMILKIGYINLIY